VIRYFEEHACSTTSPRAGPSSSAAAEIAERYPIAGDLRGRGLLYCLDFVGPGDGGRSPAPQPVGTAVQQAARRRGSLARASPHNATLAPPLVADGGRVTEIATSSRERAPR
jgi:adenosylmethionine-8-amino-7-oxononanoate aminotransferase